MSGVTKGTTSDCAAWCWGDSPVLVVQVQIQSGTIDGSQSCDLSVLIRLIIDPLINVEIQTICQLLSQCNKLNPSVPIESSVISPIAIPPLDTGVMQAAALSHSHQPLHNKLYALRNWSGV